MSKTPMARNNSNNENVASMSNHHRQRGHRSRRRRPIIQSRALTEVQDFESVSLEQAVRELNCFDDALGPSTNRRVVALEYLEDILGRWCLSVEEESQLRQAPSSSKPLSFAAVAAAGTATSQTSQAKSFASAVATTAAKPNAWQRKPVIQEALTNESSPSAALIPFGSYRLGVHSTDSDLDLLALAPPFVARSDFFASLVQLLEKDERCHQIHPIPTAYTPVIKFVLSVGEDALHIDLVFARVQDATKLVQYHKQKQLRKTIIDSGQPAPAPAVYRLDDSDLQGLDEAGVRSLNGARVSQMLLASVPNIPKFQTVLRAVKQWAVVRGIYSNVLGFLGGVNWAIMTAYVCRQFPQASAACTLRLFFRTFACWKWNTPVMLSEIQEIPPVTNLSTQTRAVTLPAWNPHTNPRDRLHIMPIITPAYPSMNSSYNLGVSQLRRIQQEMIQTSASLQKNRKNNSEADDGNPYREIFSPSDFFVRHKHFLQVRICARSQQDFVEWFRFVESKIRLLISSLETPQVQAVPFARFFDVSTEKKRDDGGASQCEKCFFIGLRFAHNIDTINIKHLTMDFLFKVNSWERRNASMELFMSHLTDDMLPLFVWDVMKKDNRSSGGGADSSHKDGAEHSVASENTAPSTDEEEEDDENSSCHSAVVPNQGSLRDLASPTKKLCIMVTQQQLA